MNHDDLGPDEQPTESDVIGLLGTYADALENNERTQHGGTQNSTIQNELTAGGFAQREGEAEMNQEPEFVDVEVTSPDEPNARRGRILAGVGAFAVAALAIGGGLLLTNQNDSSEVDVAANTPAVEQENDQDDGEPGDSSLQDSDSDEGVDLADLANEEALESPLDAATSSFGGFGFGPGTVVFADGEFVRIGNDTEGEIVIERSEDGTDWTREATTGLPEFAQASHLVETDSGWATVLEVSADSGAELGQDFSFGPGPQPDLFLATSENLIDWRTEDLPVLDVEDGGFAWVTGLAASGDRVVVLMQVDNSRDEFRILIDNGYLTEDDLESFCGSDFSEGGPFIGLSCDFDEEAMEDEFPVGVGQEVLEGEEEELRDDFAIEQEELFRVEPGDPGYDELAEVYTSSNEPPPSVVVTGTVGGEFEVVELPVAGWSNGVSGTAGGFAIAVNNFGTGVVSLLSSPDGVVWTDTETPSALQNLDRVVASNGRILTVGSSFDGGNDVQVIVSDDLGATWTINTLETDLFGAYGMATGGQAGFAIKIDGTTEPFEDPFEDLGELAIVKDGFTMLMDLGLPGGASLLGPDGEVIHDTVGAEAFFEGVEGVIRSDDFGDVLTWLDPETGEDLVSFEEADFDAAFSEAFGDDDPFADGDFPQQETETQIWFSADGITWALLDSDAITSGPNGFTEVVAVGDDEVLVRSESFAETVIEPPEELFAFETEGREPTEEEMAAIDSFFNEGSIGSTVWTAIPIN